jgi:hypothetical protein
VALLHYENWDGVTAPAIPSGWTMSSTNLATSSTPSGVTPTSSPNVLALASAATINTWFTGTYDTLDGNSGNVIVQANIAWGATITSVSQWSLFCRCGDTTANYSSSTLYYGWVNDPSGPPSIGSSGNQIGISKIVGGTATQLINLTGLTFTSGTWYTLFFTANGTQLSLAMQRISDGYWLNSAGSWIPSQATAVAISDSSVTGQGYAGLAAVQTTTADLLYSDDWYLYTIPSAYPPRPLVVPYPFQYYPSISE